MGKVSEGSAEQFALALGVTVIEVDDLDRRCIVFEPDNGRVQVCRKLCHERRSKGFEDLLRRL